MMMILQCFGTYCRGGPPGPLLSMPGYSTFNESQLADTHSDWTPMCERGESCDTARQDHSSQRRRLASLPSPAARGQYFVRKVRVVDS